jgi:hypothetical protein
MSQFDFLTQSHAVELPDPAQLMTLQQMATNNQLARYKLAQEQRKDAAAKAEGQYLPQLQGENVDITALLNSAPEEARHGLLAQYQTMQKNKQEAAFKESEAFKNNIEGKVKAMSDVANAAANADPNDPMALLKVKSRADFYKIPLPAPPTQDLSTPEARSSYLHSIASTAIDAATRMKDATTRAGQAQTAATASEGHAVTQRGQDSTLSAKNAEMQFQANKDDPFGIYGVTAPTVAPQPSALRQPSPAASPQVALPSRTGTPSAAPGPVSATPNDLTMNVSPELQGQRDQQANLLKQRELADAADAATKAGRNPATDPTVIALQKELSQSGAAAPQAGAPQESPQDRAAVGAAMRSAMAQNLHGEEFIKLLPPIIANEVKAFANYDLPVSARNAQGTSKNQMLQMLALQYNPDFSYADYGAKQKTAKDFSPSGVSGKQMAAYNLATQHMAEWTRQMGNLDNVNAPFGFANTPINAAKSAMGFGSVAGAKIPEAGLPPEMAAAFRATGMAEPDIQRWEAGINRNMTPDAQRAAVDSMLHMLDSRQNILRDQYQQGMGKPLANGAVYPSTEEARTALQAFVAGQQSKKSSPAAKSTDSDFTAKSKSGKVFHFSSAAAARAAQFDFDKQ